MTASEMGWSIQGVDTKDCFRASARQKRRSQEKETAGKENTGNSRNKGKTNEKKTSEDSGLHAYAY